MQFNIFPFVIEAMGYNRRIYPLIDELYQTDKLTFYNLAKNHELYNHMIVKEGGLLQEEYSKKALGLLIKAETDQEIELAISRMFKVGWKSVYTYVENKKSLDLGEFLKYLIKKNNGLDNISDDFINTNMLMAYIMAVSLKKDVIKNEQYKTFINSLGSRWGYYNDNEYRLSLSRMSDDDRVLINQLNKELNIKNMESLLTKERELSEIPSFLFDFEYISSISVFDDVDFTPKDLDEILFLYILQEDIIKKYSLKKLCFCFFMYLKYMIKAYKQVKEHYFQNNKETMFFEFKTLENKLKETEDKAEYTESILEKANETIEQQKREIRRLQQEILLSEREKKELYALREFVFALDKKEEYTPTEDDQVDLSNTKGVILGGHERWQAKMKEILPNFTFIHQDNLNFDTRIIDNAEYLFIYTNYLNHAIYNRAMSAVDGTRIFYLQQQNEDLVLKEIKNSIRKVISDE